MKTKILAAFACVLLASSPALANKMEDHLMWCITYLSGYAYMCELDDKGWLTVIENNDRLALKEWYASQGSTERGKTVRKYMILTAKEIVKEWRKLNPGD